MDFSNDVFRSPPQVANFSHDTMDHAKMVMSCRFGWSAGPENPNFPQQLPTSQSSAPTALFTNPANGFKSDRFRPCAGRLYHQLTCSHRIRTDMVEDCGLNCLDPPPGSSYLPFYCHECIEQETSKIWSQREAQHNTTYPPLNNMTARQYQQWYAEHQQLEAQYNNDRKIYVAEVKARTRPSNQCSAAEASKEDMEFVAELDSLSLAMVGSNDSSSDPPQSNGTANKSSLPSDASEQLHWSLNSLYLDRGSCGVEYTAQQPNNGIPPVIPPVINMDEEELWRKPRNRD